MHRLHNQAAIFSDLKPCHTLVKWMNNWEIIGSLVNLLLSVAEASAMQDRTAAEDITHKVKHML